MDNKLSTNIHNELQKLMQTDMDRKDFIKYVGVGFASLMGVTTILKTLTKLNDTPKTAKAASFYGSSVYGGHK